jgi:UDP:flavonoid glycosyltransferase YjiC (YdhE family)
MMGLARMLHEQGVEVLFAVPKNQEFLFRGTGFNIIAVPGYNIKYYNRLSPTLSLLWQIPKILFTFLREPWWARKLTHRHNIQLIVSDNRPFFRTSQAYSVYVTHQLNLPIGGFWKKGIQKVYDVIISRFDHCLVPDFPNHAFSGELSKNGNLKIPVDFCGPLSRFIDMAKVNSETNSVYDLVFIATGPQPFRDETVARVKKCFKEQPGKFAVIGDNKLKTKTNESNLDVFGNLETEAFLPLLLKSRALFSLAGYTTIMDAAVLGKPLFMWPTPGQGEQEYLAKHLKGTKGFYVLDKPEEVRLTTVETFTLSVKDLVSEQKVDTPGVILKLIQCANDGFKKKLNHSQ